MEKGDIIKTTKHLKFKVVELKPKTVCISVINHSEQGLGYIEWYSPWRQYCYFPEEEIIMANSCLQDIVGMIKELMDKRKEIKNG